MFHSSPHGDGASGRRKVRILELVIFLHLTSQTPAFEALVALLSDLLPEDADEGETVAVRALHDFVRVRTADRARRDECTRDEFAQIRVVVEEHHLVFLPRG